RVDALVKVDRARVDVLVRSAHPRSVRDWVPMATPGARPPDRLPATARGPRLRRGQTGSTAVPLAGAGVHPGGVRWLLASVRVLRPSPDGSRRTLPIALRAIGSCRSRASPRPVAPLLVAHARIEKPVADVDDQVHEYDDQGAKE